MSLQFSKIAGTGGIGSGVLFQMSTNESLSRNESRLAVLSDARDYCKQHIILHYVAKMLSPGVNVIAIGKVGDDGEGKRLLLEMAQAGIDTRFVQNDPDNPTMYSVCIQYADKSGFNVTSSNNASGAVTPRYINGCIDSISGGIDEKTLVLAAPEVPVESRIALLERGKSGGAFCAASVLREEAGEFRRLGGFELCDLLAVNEDEAQAISGKENTDKLKTAKACYAELAKYNPNIALIVTAGEQGSYCVQGGNVEHIPAVSSAVVNTAGAGDAYLAGVICGLALGMPLQYLRGGNNEVIRATDFGALLAGLSLESKHTIADNIDKNDVMKKLQNIIKAGSYDIQTKIRAKVQTIQQDTIFRA